MATKWQEKGVGMSLRMGGVNKKPVIDDRDGSIGGYETEHWDDHQDVNVLAKPIRVSLTVNEVEGEE